MKKILIVVNAIVYNRGSEALVRGISKLCKKSNSDTCITLVSSEDNFGNWISIENIDMYSNKINYKSKSIIKYLVAILKKLKFLSLVNFLKYSKLKKISKDQDLIIIIGADNYDITYNMQEELKRLHTYLRKNNKAKMLLYDCSLDERDITKVLKEDINNFDAITVRESISYENVKEDIEKNKLFLYPDPAFVMDKEEVSLPDVFKNSKVIGVNVSNLITNSKYGSNTYKILNAYKNMINYILEFTDMNVLLVPHVMNGADLSTLKELYKGYENNSRVYLVEDENLNAKQLKYIISNCELFVGARTHATIAAYSTNVPTLVLGYSVKSKGIAKDLFGTFENYVLPVNKLENEEYLVNGFRWLLDNKDNIYKKLEKELPNYIERVEHTEDVIKEIIGE